MSTSNKSIPTSRWLSLLTHATACPPGLLDGVIRAVPIRDNTVVLIAFRAYCKQLSKLYPCEAVTSTAINVLTQYCRTSVQHLDVEAFFECVACFASHRARITIADQERDALATFDGESVVEGDYTHPCISQLRTARERRVADQAWCDICITVVYLMGRSGGGKLLGKNALITVSGMACFPVVEAIAARSLIGFWAYASTSGPESVLAFAELACNLLQYTDDIRHCLIDMDTRWGAHMHGIPVASGCAMVAILHLLWNYLVFTPGCASTTWCPLSPICESDLVSNARAYSPSIHALNIIGVFMIQASRAVEATLRFTTAGVSMFKRVVVSLLREYGHVDLLVVGCVALLGSLGLGTEHESSLFTPTDSRELGSVFACVSRFQREPAIGMRYVSVFYSSSVAFKEGFDDRRLKTIRRDRHVVAAVVASGYRTSATSVAGVSHVRPRVRFDDTVAMGLLVPP